MKFSLTLWCGIAIAQCPLPGPPIGFPSYCEATVVNSAAKPSGLRLAPNTIGTVYGKNLATITVALTAADITADGYLPTHLPGSDTVVSIGGLEATPFYISPTQINFLVPVLLPPGPTTLNVMSRTRAGPILNVRLLPAAPALFLLDAQTAVATHLDGSVVTATRPARPGEIVTLYANGLGPTSPPAQFGQLPIKAAPLLKESDFQVLLDGLALPAENVLYAGAAPLFAGLYQINLQLAAAAPLNPEIRLLSASQLSPPQIHLTVQP